jgi:translocation and assembly module TamB
MSRRTKLVRNIAIVLAGVFAAIILAAVVVVRTDGFRNWVKQKIIAAAGEGTGGKVEIGSFSIDWRNLRAVATDFVIHGNEPAGSPPYLRARRAQVDLRLFTGPKHIPGVAYLGLDKPEMHVVVLPDGRTNIPTPARKSTSNETALETVVDLAVSHFELTNGQFTFNSQKQPLDVRGNNLRVQLWYDGIKQSYQGHVSLEPLYVLSGRNTPVRFAIALPVVLERDRIEFQNARITTAASDIRMDGSVNDLRKPQMSVRVGGHLALADLKNASLLPPDLDLRNAPSKMDLAANVTLTDTLIEVAGLRCAIGNSSLEASGKLKDPAGKASLQFETRLAVGEVGRWVRSAARPEGTVALKGTAKLDANNNYEVSGHLDAKNLSFQAGERRIRDINLVSEVRLDPHRVAANGIHLTAMGAEIAADASLEDMARYRIKGNLRSLDLAAAVSALGQQGLTYDGTVTGGIEAEGDLKTPGTKSIQANAQLSVAPGRRGVPVSGRLYAGYSGATDNVTVTGSYIALPHTRLSVSGSIGSRLDVALASRDLNDLQPLIMDKRVPIALDGGQASFQGAITGSLSAPRITGHLAMDRFLVEGRRIDTLEADLTGSDSRAAVSNGRMARSTMQARFAAAAGLNHWKPAPNQPISAEASIQNGDLADILALLGKGGPGFSGDLSAEARVDGTMGNPRGSASLRVSNGKIRSEPFDTLQVQVNMADQRITIPSASITAGAARAGLTAEFQHPRDSLSTGQLYARLQTNQVNLAQVGTLQKDHSNTAGLVEINAEVAANLTEANGGEDGGFLLTRVTADASARGLRFEGQAYGDFSVTARTNGQALDYTVNSDFAGSNIQVKGNTLLARGYPTNAGAEIRHLPVDRLLTLARRQDIPAKGDLSATLHFSGSMDNPEGSLDLDLANAVLYDEPLDRVRAKMTYGSKRIDLSQFEMVAGSGRLEAAAQYDHVPGNLESGNLEFHVNSSAIDLARIRAIQRARPGTGGSLQVALKGAAMVGQSGAPVRFRDLDAKLAATRITRQRQAFGDLTLTANTTGGMLKFALDSNLAGTSIRGNGTAQLGGEYPVNAQVTFSNVAWTRLRALLGPSTVGQPNFEGLADGQVAVNGPVGKVEDLRGSIRLTRLELSALQEPAGARKPIAIQNEGPIVATLDRGAARIESLHLAGPETDLRVSGELLLPAQTMNLSINANANLAVLGQFNRNMVSSGEIVLETKVRGSVGKPLVNGRLDLRNASVNYSEIANGISNANGTVLFNGNSASVRNLTAESGGGKITLGGFLSYAEMLRFGLRANASNVRVRVQPGVSVVANADVRLTGKPESSVVSGTATIEQLIYAPQSDFGSILSRSADPVKSPEAASPLLDNMKLDVQVRTSSAMSVQASMAQNLQADANLRIGGTASQPGMLGRVSVSDGQLVFFGSTYTINSGTISFYNPVRIEPVLNMSLETQAKGVDVVLNVTGPVDNMKLSYTSDPPLQFQEIVNLLASGKTPTSDPTLLAKQPSEPKQSVGQMGESALLSKALTDPVATRLQRVFGVSQLKIDPTFASGSDVPQARFTLQQRVSSAITFTYITSINDPNGQIVRVEWAVNPQWSALATRDQNGMVSLRFLYKKQFR